MYVIDIYVHPLTSLICSLRTNWTIESAIESNKLMNKNSLRNWYICQVVIGSILMTAVEIVLMARGG